MRQKHPLIELKNIHKHFPDFQLDEVNLQLHKGEVHVLIGENGSGKSTLMKLISGWFPPDGGAILYRGEPVQFHSIHEAQKNGIIYLHQDVQSFNNLSVAENVFFGRIPRFWGIRAFVDLERMLAECQQVFAELQIPIDPKALLGKLGYAERQLVAAARAYVADADLVIFDEPTSAMSEPDREILFDILKKDGELGIKYELGEGRETRTPQEVLGTKAADCNEFALLFAVCAKKFEIEVKDVRMLVMDLHLQVGKSPGHAALITSKEGSYLIDPAYLDKIEVFHPKKKTLKKRIGTKWKNQRKRKTNQFSLLQKALKNCPNWKKITIQRTQHQSVIWYSKLYPPVKTEKVKNHII